ncbi:unnamed protein product [Clonostachys chloroleuca]|uniref:Uncharacterized protein n=1 Tax=Clonostachys chloroleuca TaxID=1926264 RepID=A0AA35VJ18_9HYPO|nr:unnamed protein product [Clonostachys chloroleuca]
MATLPNGLISFGPDANCTLELCPVEWSVYTYRPSLVANIALPIIFGILGLIHTYLGFRWKSWGFMVGMQLGSVSAIIGYGGRIMMYNDPFSFAAFIMQTLCLTIAPVFYTASIYVTLSKTVIFFDPSLSRFKPKLFYWIFLPLDILCLILQSAGGALSSILDDPDIGVGVSLAGLVLQVVVLFFFGVAFTDYMVRYWMTGRASSFDWRIKAFLSGLAIAVILILARSAYRVAELRDGYHGEMMKHEIPFIVLEGVLIVLSGAALLFSHPGFVFSRPKGIPVSSSSESEIDMIAVHQDGRAAHVASRV